ncbi:MAG: aldo/keto reductase [Planctomycetes bacterium]|nr:aldo/keto reductase [Planctomycetota bacterium]
MSQDRRSFLGAVAATGAGAAGVGAAEAAQAAPVADPAPGVPTRPLGRTRVNVSILCLGGWHIGAVKEPKEAIRIMHAAIDEGITFFDNAWDYHDGGSEEIMGRALAMDGRRKRVFLMTKNCARDAAGTRRHLEDSLRRLRTDVIDLWQFHEINYDNDPDWIVERGALREALRAQKEGKIRFIGYTGHKSPHIHLRMLGVHNWDTVQMPVNVCDYHYRSFVREVIPEAAKRNIAVLGMKSLGGGAAGRGRFIAETVCSVEEAINYALSQRIASLVVGIDSMAVLKQDLAIVRRFPSLDAEALKKLVARVRPHAGDGRHERFKSTQHFDGPFHRAQHGLTQKEIER